MTARKSERLVNLVILMLVANTYVTKEQIRQLTEPYRDLGKEAFEKMFERDKAELRALGIPIEMGSVDPYFDDEQGYRINRGVFELPPLEFAPEEVAVLGLAARVWQHAGLASATSDALVKLKAAGLEVDRSQLDVVQPTLSADEPGFAAMLEATTTRTPVRFDYQRPGQVEVIERHLHPWAVITVAARWYVLGLDTDREEPRMFRLSRVRSEVRKTGDPGSYAVPEDLDLAELSTSLAPPTPPSPAQVLVRSDAALGLRRGATLLETGVSGPDATTGWDRLRIDYDRESEIVATVLAHGTAVLLESPQELVDVVRDRLRAVVDAEPVGARR